MMRLFCSLLLLAFTAGASAQDYPVLKALSEKDRQERLKPEFMDGSWGYVNSKGKFRIKPCFDMAEDFLPAYVSGTDTVYVAKIMYGGRFGFVASNGLYFKMPEFDSISDFDRGVAIFRRNGACGLLTGRGSVVMDGMEDIRPFGECGTAWFLKDGRWGLCNLAGKILLPCKYTELPNVLSGSVARFEAGGRYGLLSMKDGKEVLPPEYDHVSVLENGFVKILKNGLYGLADPSGKVIMPSKMMTDQIAEGHDFCQYFDNDPAGRPALMALYNGKAMNMKQLDDEMHKVLGRDAYLNRHDPSCQRFPHWLRRHVMADAGQDAFGEYWKSDNAYHLPAGSGRKSGTGVEIPKVNDIYVVVGRDFKVLECSGLGLEQGDALQKAKIPAGSLEIPCGSWLAPFLTSVNGARLSEYDSRNGTSVADWSVMSAHVRNSGPAAGGDYAAVVDIMVEDALMQRVFVKFTAAGARRLAIVQDGALYSMDEYVDPEDSRCFVTEGMLVISSFIGPERRPVTRLYTKAGKLLTDLPELYCEIILDSGNDLKMLGRDAYFFCRSEVNMAARKYTKKDLGLDVEKLRMEFDGVYVYFYDRNSGLLKSIMETSEGSVPIPALRFTDGVWDGRRIAAVSVNQWDFQEETKWVFVPRIASGSVVENINGYMFTIYPAGPDGVAIYSVNPDIWTNEGLRYGYIGFDDGFFTQPLFEAARHFVDGTADVRIGGEWLKVDKSRCAELGKMNTTGR